eukprot:TRINITY_DN39326_c0_g1_i1.p1 TRINITY_DN39326_c0_g1~~TRINITY_DN39326_c0_g1_i1.p1  ORF type:complete len:206 (-),score=38.30 TRINITY_DN39326_c0_g1_i1:487-1104(-)
MYPTSLMIKNIPSRAMETEVIGAVDAAGFQGLYDFFYLPMPRIKNVKTVSNRGYGFINFKDPEGSKRFMDFICSPGITVRSSYKVLDACHARAQGRDALMSCAIRARSDALPWILVAGQLVRMCKTQLENVARLDEVENSAKIAVPTGEGDILTIEPQFVDDLLALGSPMTSHIGASSLPLYVRVDSAYYADIIDHDIPQVTISL